MPHKKKIDWEKSRRIERVKTHGHESIYANNSAKDYAPDRLRLSGRQRIQMLKYAKWLLSWTTKSDDTQTAWLNSAKGFLTKVPNWMLDEEIEGLVADIKHRYAKLHGEIRNNQTSYDLGSLRLTLQFIEDSLEQKKYQNITLGNIVFCRDHLDPTICALAKDECVKQRVKFRILIKKFAAEKLNIWASTTHKGRSRWPNPDYLGEWIAILTSIEPSVGSLPYYPEAKFRSLIL